MHFLTNFDQYNFRRSKSNHIFKKKKKKKVVGRRDVWKVSGRVRKSQTKVQRKLHYKDFFDGRLMHGEIYKFLPLHLRWDGQSLHGIAIKEEVLPRSSWSSKLSKILPFKNLQTYRPPHTVIATDVINVSGCLSHVHTVFKLLKRN